jgi:hypothetical protein
MNKKLAGSFLKPNIQMLFEKTAQCHEDIEMCFLVCILV